MVRVFAFMTAVFFAAGSLRADSKKLTEDQRIEIMRGLVAEYAKAVIPLPRSQKPLEVDPEGVRKRIVTKHGRVRASHVVLAGNVHLAELAPRLARTLVPVHTYVVTSAPAGEALREAILARFCADALRESYFGWDARRHATASEHNQWRTRGQLQVATHIAAEMDTLEAITARASG